MSNRKSQKSQFPAWQARHKHERFVRIPRSMEESPAWMALGKNAIRLYLKCMAWTYDAENRKKEKAPPLHMLTEATTSPQKNMRAELLFSMRGKKRHSVENFQIPKTPQ